MAVGNYLSIFLFNIGFASRNKVTVPNLTVKPKIRSWIKEKRNRNQHTEYDDCWDDEEENSFLGKYFLACFAYNRQASD